jgi:hypothetical protein
MTIMGNLGFYLDELLSFRNQEELRILDCLCQSIMEFPGSSCLNERLLICSLPIDFPSKGVSREKILPSGSL